MKTPKINLQAVSASARDACFSTKTVSKGQIPRILNEYKSLCHVERQNCEDVVQSKLKQIEEKIDNWKALEDPKNKKKDSKI